MEQTRDEWEKYLYPGTDILKNNLDITNQDQLTYKEIEISFQKLFELHEMPIDGDFDAKHLCDIHRYIFKDIYPFAGEFRTCDMRKAGFPFTNAKEIEFFLNSAINQMHEDFKACSNFGHYTNFLAEYFYQLLHVHPFREGNGRTIREFLREFVIKYIDGYNLDWSKMDPNEYNQAIEYAFIGRSLLQLQFAKALVLADELEYQGAKTDGINLN